MFAEQEIGKRATDRPDEFGFRAVLDAEEACRILEYGLRAALDDGARDEIEPRAGCDESLHAS